MKKWLKWGLWFGGFSLSIPILTILNVPFSIVLLPLVILFILAFLPILILDIVLNSIFGIHLFTQGPTWGAAAGPSILGWIVFVIGYTSLGVMIGKSLDRRKRK